MVKPVTVKQAMQSVRLISDYNKPTDEAFTYWKNINKGLLDDRKKKLEKELEQVNRLIVENNNSKDFSDTLQVYGKYQSL